MPSPDLRPYIDLTLFDRDAQGIVDRALTDLQVALPEWTPQEGNNEVALLEALALEVSELTFAANRAPGAVVEAILGLYGLTYDQGQAATATARFFATDTIGHTLLAGTTVRLEISDELSVDFTLDANLVIAPGLSEAVGAITATVVGIAPNGAAAGTSLAVVDAITYLDAVQLETAPAGGTEPETSVAFLDRGAQVLRRLVSTLVLPDHFTAAVLTDARVYRALTLDNFDPATGPNPGDNPGHVTVAVAGPGGTLLTAPVKAELDALLEAQSAAMLAVHVVDPTITAVPVSVTVHRLSTYSDAQVTANITAALAAYLNPDAWEWSGTVRRHELISVIDQAAGVDYVTTLTAPAADVVLAGDANLVTLGTVTITVTS